MIPFEQAVPSERMDKLLYALVCEVMDYREVTVEDKLEPRDIGALMLGAFRLGYETARRDAREGAGPIKEVSR